MSAILTKLKRRYVILRSLELLLTGIGIGLITWVALGFMSAPPVPVVLSISLTAGYIAYRVWRLKLLQLTNGHIAAWLNRKIPSLEQSTDLLVAPVSQLTGLERIQLNQVSTELEKVKDQINVPHHLLMGLIILVTGIAIFSFVSVPVRTPAIEYTQPVTDQEKPLPHQIPQVAKVTLEITPPTYIGQAPIITSQLHIKAPENSTIKWTIGFTQPTDKAYLLFSNKDSLTLRKENGSFSTPAVGINQGFYSIHWTDKAGSYESDYYPIEMIPDQPPSINMGTLKPYTEVGAGAKVTIPLQASMADDYGLKDAFIVATVAKGSGESVKFREEIFRFTTPTQFNKKEHIASRNLDVIKLGLAPGDELYFYVVALDGRTPKPNQSRTETFFVAVKDTATLAVIADEGLGVDLMPDYFRSQRQIIIDTEKLLKEKKSIAKTEFNSRSNELGYDQKVLRLKYGQFLGEEFESGIGGATLPDAEEEEADPVKRFGHQHDTENEHNLVPDKSKDAQAKQGHEHEKQAGQEGKQENPLDEFIHQHDNTEEATFFVMSVKAKLRAALTLMWDAELHLRLYTPQTSLPYQYKILKLLKEISNDSRIYVHRTGFDPPPIKEEKRLAGDLTEISDTRAFAPTNPDDAFPAIRSVTSEMELMIQSEDSLLNPTAINHLRAAGNEFSAVAMLQPSQIEALSLIKGLVDNRWQGETRKSALKRVRAAFWQIIPSSTATPSRGNASRHSVENKFLKNLEPTR